MFRESEADRGCSPWWRLAYGALSFLAWPAFACALLSGRRRALLSRRLRPPRSAPRGGLWVHALSVGEARAAEPLLRELRAHLEAPVVFTVTTASAFRLAEERMRGLCDLLWASPPDLWPVRERFVRALAPRLYVLVETDLWPGLLWALRRSGARLCLANAALSARSSERLERVPGLARFLYGAFHLIGAATRGDKARLERLLPEREILYLGNLKFDRPAPRVEEAEDLIRELAPLLSPPVIVCGSTHPGEEELWLRAFRRLGQGSLVLCPRRVERAEEVLARARELGLAASRRSSPAPCAVLVVDTLGELSRLYALADVAFVGGSLVPVGGHNLLEPAAWGKPVLFGPWVESIEDVALDLEREGGGLRVEPDEEGLLAALEEAVARRHSMGRRAFQVFRQHRGAAARYREEIVRLLGEDPTRPCSPPYGGA